MPQRVWPYLRGGGVVGVVELVARPARELSHRVAYSVLHNVLRRGELLQPRVAVFMVGLPGAGKSRCIDRRYAPGTNSTAVVDLDVEIRRHPRFDPADPNALYVEPSQEAYHWADAQVERRFSEAISNPGLRRVVIDGTGTNAERQVRRMAAARDAGWYVKVLYVRVPVRIAVARAATRKRTVSPARVRMYQARIAAALPKVVPYADEVETFSSPDEPEADPRQSHLFADSISTITAG